MLGKVRSIKNKFSSAIETLLALNVADHERHKENNHILHELVVKSRETLALLSNDLTATLDNKHTAIQLLTRSKQIESILSELSTRGLVTRDALLNVLENQKAIMLALHEVAGLRRNLEALKTDLSLINSSMVKAEDLERIDGTLAVLRRYAEQIDGSVARNSQEIGNTRAVVSSDGQSTRDVLTRVFGQDSDQYWAEITNEIKTEIKAEFGALRVVSEQTATRNRTALVFSDTVACSKPAEISLMRHLLDVCESKDVIDVGAHHGKFSAEFLKDGKAVYAIEPAKESFSILSELVQKYNQLTVLNMAVGSHPATKFLHIARSENERLQKFASAFNSLDNHNLPTGIAFATTEEVQVTTINSLIEDKTIPGSVALLKIDTEGFDLSVLQGATNIETQFTVCEYWDSRLYLASGSAPSLGDIVEHMMAQGYRSYLVLATIDGTEDVFFYADSPETAEGAWGNVFFFKDATLFDRAYVWADRHLRRAYPIRSRW